MVFKSQVATIIADIPVYASVAWLYLAKVIDPANFPQWEEWLFYHGWLLLLAIRLFNAVVDSYKKVIAEYSTPSRDENGRFSSKPKLTLSQKIYLTIQKLWSRR
jgi:hypothetical protein